MKVTEKQIAKWIESYLNSKYANMVLTRNLDRMLIHKLQCDRRDEFGVKVSVRWKEFIKENISVFEDYNDFESIHDKVAEFAKQFFGIGDLTIYDTATCIGCPKGIFPKVVYMHLGTQEGANALGVTGSIAEKKQFVAKCKDFERLEPIQIEDFLCIYKNQLHGKTTELPKGC